MLQRHSSRRTRLDHTVLTKRLEGAVSYVRIPVDCDHLFRLIATTDSD